MAKQTKKVKEETVNQEPVQEEVNKVEQKPVQEEVMEEPTDIEGNTKINDALPSDSLSESLGEGEVNAAEQSPDPSEEVAPENAEEGNVDEIEGNTISDEKLLEMAEQIKKEGESLKELNEITPETEQMLKEKVSDIEELEKELREDIKKNESALNEENKSAANKLFRRGFSDFWNGVSDGWNN